MGDRRWAIPCTDGAAGVVEAIGALGQVGPDVFVMAAGDGDPRWAIPRTDGAAGVANAVGALGRVWPGGLVTAAGHG